MKSLFIIVLGASVWSVILYRLIDLTHFTNEVKAIIAFIISIILFFIVKIIDNTLNSYAE